MPVTRSHIFTRTYEKGLPSDTPRKHKHEEESDELDCVCSILNGETHSDSCWIAGPSKKPKLASHSHTTKAKRCKGTKANRQSHLVKNLDPLSSPISMNSELVGFDLMPGGTACTSSNFGQMLDDLSATSVELPLVMPSELQDLKSAAPPTPPPLSAFVQLSPTSVDPLDEPMEEEIESPSTSSTITLGQLSILTPPPELPEINCTQTCAEIENSSVEPNIPSPPPLSACGLIEVTDNAATSSNDPPLTKARRLEKQTSVTFSDVVSIRIPTPPPFPTCGFYPIVEDANDFHEVYSTRKQTPPPSPTIQQTQSLEITPSSELHSIPTPPPLSAFQWTQITEDTTTSVINVPSMRIPTPPPLPTVEQMQMLETHVTSTEVNTLRIPTPPPLPNFEWNYISLDDNNPGETMMDTQEETAATSEGSAIRIPTPPPLPIFDWNQILEQDATCTAVASTPIPSPPPLPAFEWNEDNNSDEESKENVGIRPEVCTISKPSPLSLSSPQMENLADPQEVQAPVSPPIPPPLTDYDFLKMSAIWLSKWYNRDEDSNEDSELESVCNTAQSPPASSTPIQTYTPRKVVDFSHESLVSSKTFRKSTDLLLTSLLVSPPSPVFAFTQMSASCSNANQGKKEDDAKKTSSKPPYPPQSPGMDILSRYWDEESIDDALKDKENK